MESEHGKREEPVGDGVKGEERYWVVNGKDCCVASKGECRPGGSNMF